MYYLESCLSKKDYLSELKRTFRSPFLLYDERVCGTIIGPFFSIAYHSPYEWSRRFTGECNRAWGYVKDVDGKSAVRFIRGKGEMSPFWFIFYSVICYLVFLLTYGYDPNFLWIAMAVSFVICLSSVFRSTITENGEAGFHEVTRLLLHPEDYYG